MIDSLCPGLISGTKSTEKSIDEIELFLGSKPNADSATSVQGNLDETDGSSSQIPNADGKGDFAYKK